MQLILDTERAPGKAVADLLTDLPVAERKESRQMPVIVGHK